MTKNGFVDLQVNGYKGITFTSPQLTIAQIRKVTQDLVKAGTIAYCPTICTNSKKVYEHTLPFFARVMKDAELAQHILGLHLEGPFISPMEGARGAHPPEHIVKPDIELLKRFQDLAEGHIVILTVAPESEGCVPFIKYAVKNGIRISMGHHLAENNIIEQAVRAGATASTHLGNGMPNMINRHKNPIWWQLACDDIYGMFITDGHHLPADFIKVALRAKTVDRSIVTSDASSLSGMPPGQYTLPRGLEVVIEETGRIFSPSTGGLAGSHSTMIECMNHLASLNLLTEDELWQVGFENPLRVLGKKPKDLADLNGPEVVFEKGQFVVK